MKCNPPMMPHRLQSRDCLLLVGVPPPSSKPQRLSSVEDTRSTMSSLTGSRESSEERTPVHDVNPPSIPQRRSTLISETAVLH